MLSAKCSKCGVGFRSKTRSDLLSKIRKHVWKEHEEWMKSRIKRGMKEVKARSNPRIIGALEAPVIEKLTGVPYEQVRQHVLTFMKRLLIDALTGGK